MRARRIAFPLCASLAAVVMSAAAEAQAPRAVSVGLGVGATIPLGDFASDTKTGAHGTAYLQYEPERNVWAVRGEFGYHRSDYTDDFLGDVGADPDDNLSNSVSYLGATALLIGRKRDGAVTPYLLGGLGAYRMTATFASGPASISESANGVGFNAGAGIRWGAMPDSSSRRAFTSSR